MITYRKPLIHLLCTSLLILCTGSFQFISAQNIQSSISLGDRSATASDSLSVPVQIYSNGGLVGLQFDVSYNGARVDISDLTPNTLSTDHGFSFKEIGEGIFRVLIYSTSNAELENGIIGDLEVTTTEAFANDKVGLSLSNLSFVTANGTTLSVDAAPFVQVTNPGGPIAANELDEVDLSAVAIALNGDITRVEFQIDGRTVGVDTDGPYTLSWAVDAPGNVLLTAVAIDEDGNTGISPELSIDVTPSPFLEAWRNANFSEAQRMDPGISGFNSDPDQDRILNFFELALGSNPLVADPDSLPFLDVVEIGADDFLALSYQRPEGLGDLNYTAEISSDLDNWTQLTEEVVSTTNGMEEILARSTTPFTGDPEFLRLRIEPKGE